MTAPPAGALDLPEPYALEIGARFDQSGSVLMELIVEPTSQEWRGGDKQPLYTAEQMREYALLAALRLREALQACIVEWREDSLTLGESDGYGAQLDRCADDLAAPAEGGQGEVFGYVYQFQDEEPAFEYAGDRWPNRNRHSETAVYTTPPAARSES